MANENKKRKSREPHYVDIAVIKDNIQKLIGGLNKNKDRYNFAVRLNDLLSNMKLHQANFAEKINIADGTLSNYRNGSREPTLTVLCNMANELNVPLDYLVGRSDVIDYKLDDINKHIGLSEEAIMALYMLRHSDFGNSFKIDEKTTDTYEDDLMLLSLILSDPFALSFLLTAIRNYISKRNEVENLKIDEDFNNSVLASERLKQEIEEAENLSFKIYRRLNNRIDEIMEAYNIYLIKKSEVEDE